MNCQVDTSGKRGGEVTFTPESLTPLPEAERAVAFGDRMAKRIGYGHLSQLGSAEVDNALCVWGVSDEVAKQLASEFAEDCIMRQVNWLPYRAGEKPSGVLIRSIQDDYTQPAGMTPDEVASVERNVADRNFRFPGSQKFEWTPLDEPPLEDEPEEVPFGGTDYQPETETDYSESVPF